MSPSRGDSFRVKTLPERIAEALPSGGAMGTIRQRLKPLFHRLLAHQGDGFRSVLPGGEIVLVSPAHRHITWNADEYTAFRTAVKPGDVVLEAGANVGAYTLLFGQWVGTAGRVFAFEPDPSAFEGLERHLSINNLSEQVTAVAAAVTDGQADHMRLVLGESSGISRMASAIDESGSRVTEVPALSIDAFCATRHLTPQVIKIDVEGAELGVLRGARATIARGGPDLHLFVEMHPQLWPALGYSAADLRRECESQHLAAEMLDGTRDEGLWTTEGVCLRLRPHAL
jgi:FkbM family methyltransferase